MKSINLSKRCYAVIALSIIILINILFCINPFGISKKLSSIFCENRVITMEELIDNSALKDFVINEDKSIVSLNMDPWINLDVSKYGVPVESIRFINIKVERKNVEDNNSEIYYIDDEGNGIYSDKFQLKVGNNSVRIYPYYDAINSIRLDLAVEPNIEIKLENIEINNADDILRDNIMKVNNINKYIIFIFVLLLCNIAGERLLRSKSKAFNVKALEMWQTAFLFVAIFINVIFLNSVAGYAVIALLMLVSGMVSEHKTSNHKLDLLFFFISLCILFIGIKAQNNSLVLFSKTNQPNAIINSWMIMWSFLTLSCIIRLCNKECGNIEKETSPLKLMILSFILFFIVYSVVLCIYNTYDSAEELTGFFIHNIWNFNFMFYSIVVMALYFILICIGGIRFSILITSIISCIAIIGNFIKLTYQGTYLKLIDFILLAELLKMMNAYIGGVVIILLVALVLAVIISIIVYRKKIVSFIGFKMHGALLVMALLMVGVIIADNMGLCKDLLKDNFSLQKPDNYSESSVKNIIKNYTNQSDNSDIKPDVILIMAESMFDVSRVPNVKFNLDCTQNIKKYQVGNIISPRFGGGTAAVEFEALTGLSNYFFIKDMVAYNYYFSKNTPINSIATEFKNNNYHTTAIHVNEGNFYKRDMVYHDMGFDEFYDIDDFTITDKDIMNDGFTKDSLFFDKVIETLESNNEQQFIFGVTIEGHAPYNNKFDETDIKAESQLLDDNEINEIEQYAQTVKDIDKEIGDLVSYIKNRKRPTLLYIWGDHLPALQSLNKFGYINGEDYNKYTVPIVVYSNYKDINIGVDNMSPIYIATQILSDSGITYNKYFDYIMSLKENYPVIHKEFTTDVLDDYYKIVYDIIKGKHYILK